MSRERSKMKSINSLLLFKVNDKKSVEIEAQYHHDKIDYYKTKIEFHNKEMIKLEKVIKRLDCEISDFKYKLDDMINDSKKEKKKKDKRDRIKLLSKKKRRDDSRDDKKSEKGNRKYNERKTVMVSRLDYKVNEGELKDLFKDLKVFKISKSLDNKGIFKGLAFIKFESEVDAERSLKRNGEIFQGRKILVKWSYTEMKDYL